MADHVGPRRLWGKLWLLLWQATDLHAEAFLARLRAAAQRRRAQALREEAARVIAKTRELVEAGRRRAASRDDAEGE